MTTNKREILADVQHGIWSHWMKWLFQCGQFNEDGSFTIPVDKVERWTRQMNTPYSDLTDKEQESDRIEADKTLKALEAAEAEADGIKLEQGERTQLDIFGSEAAS